MEIGLMKQDSKINNQNYPSFKEKLELILKLLNILICLCISEGNIPNNENKKSYIEKYNKLFKTTNNNIFMSTKNFFSFGLFKEISQDIGSFNKFLGKEVFILLKNIKQFLADEINLDNLLEKVCSSLDFSIQYIKLNKGTNYSFNLIYEFHQYLDEFSKTIMSLKDVTSKKQSKEEEIKQKENENKINQFEIKIQNLLKALEQKEKELESALNNNILLSLDVSSYRESNEILKDKLNETEIKIKEKNEENKLYKNQIDKIENTLSTFSKKFEDLEKSNSEYANQIQQLKKDKSESALNEQKLSNQIQQLEKAKSESALNEQKLSNQIQQLEKAKSESALNEQKLSNQIQQLKTKIELLEETKIQSTFTIERLSKENFQLKKECQMLNQKIENLENQVKYLMNLNDMTTKNSQREISNLKNEQNKKLKMCFDNIRTLRIHYKNLEEQNTFLYENYLTLANEVNYFVTTFLYNFKENLDEEDYKNIFNVNYFGNNNN